MTKVKNMSKKLWKARGGPLAALVIMVIALCILSPNFLGKNNLLSVSKQASCIAILALGMTMLLATGNIDLSCGSGIALTGCVAVMLINSGVNFYLACFAAIAAGAAIGLVMGSVIAYTGIAPFIVSLAFQNILRGIAYFTTGGLSVSMRNEQMRYLSTGTILGIPVMILIVAVVGICVWLVFTRTVFGRNMFAVGGNREAARYAGINLRKTTIIVYIAMGILTGVAGILFSARLSSGQPNLGTGYEGDAINAALLGGTAFTGGSGSVSGTLIGVCIVALIGNGLNLLEVSAWWQYIVQGLTVLVAIYIDNAKKQRERRA